MSIPTRTIGPFTVSSIGFGCMGLSHGYGVPIAEGDAAAVLERALDLGCTFFDTAAIYGAGANERLLGASILRRRGEFTLASKCVLALLDGKRVLDGSPRAIRRTCDDALQRLGTDTIDLYYLHRLDRTVPIEESMGAMAELVEAGKIRTVGLSEMSAATIRRAHAVHPVTAVQNEYSPAVRNPEVSVLDTCRELGIALVAFSPVARGLLAGGVHDDRWTPGDIRAGMPRFNGERLAANLAIAGRFAALAAQAGATPAQLALGWVLSRGDHVVPIPGTTRRDHLAENMTAATMRFDADLLAAVDALLPANALHGARYPAPLQAQIDAELLPDEELAEA